ncbi:hypothetical protein [Nocardioides sp.]|uniref:hypothetical protein n=1 Tax=Nocardioides sp. TaxID=35761 RepID=UPI002CB6DB31|nr:hypothetical protein [Nocardioides sp.]HXH77144.1 hypothetical protein [Nocardioides sp.]
MSARRAEVRKRVADRRRALLYEDVGNQRRARHLADVERRYRDGECTVYPNRITIALDAGGHEGPEVDAACLAAEPAVDQWEAGQAVPTWEQLVALSELTGVAVEFFLDPPDNDIGPGWSCGDGGCRVVLPHAAIAPYGSTGPPPSLTLIAGVTDGATK